MRGAPSLSLSCTLLLTLLLGLDLLDKSCSNKSKNSSSFGSDLGASKSNVSSLLSHPNASEPYCHAPRAHRYGRNRPAWNTSQHQLVVWPAGLVQLGTVLHLSPTSRLLQICLPVFHPLCETGIATCLLGHPRAFWPLFTNLDKASLSLVNSSDCLCKTELSLCSEGNSSDTGAWASALDSSGVLRGAVSCGVDGFGQYPLPLCRTSGPSLLTLRREPAHIVRLEVEGHAESAPNLSRQHNTTQIPHKVVLGNATKSMAQTTGHDQQVVPNNSPIGQGFLVSEMVRKGLDTKRFNQKIKGTTRRSGKSKKLKKRKIY